MKRYNCTDAGSTYESYGEPIMQESTTGEFVKFQDVENLIESFKGILYTLKNNGGDLFAKAIDEVEALKELGVEGE